MITRKYTIQGNTVFIFLLSCIIPLIIDAEEVRNDGPYENINESVRAILTSIASKKKEQISDAPGVVSVITKEDLRRFGGTTLSDILKRVPSFLGSTVYMTDRSVISSRGDQIMPSSSHLLLLINGRPIREIWEGGIKSEVYESFPVSVIERIEVIRGPGSVLYGSQAFSAVINIITKNAENNNATISGALGEAFFKAVSADLQYKIGDIGIVLAGRYADGQWDKLKYSMPGITPDIVHTIGVTIPDQGPGVYGEVTYKDVRLMFSYNQWQHFYAIPMLEMMRDLSEDIPGYIDGHAAGNITWKKLFGDLEYNHRFSNRYTAQWNFTYNQSLLNTVEFPFTSRDSYELLGEWTNFITPTDKVNIIIGGVYSLMNGIEKDANDNVNVYNKGIFNKGHIGHNFAGYIQTDYHQDWYKIIAGLQVNKVFYQDSLDNIDQFDVDFNPRLGMIFTPLEHINIKTLYSTAYRAPSMNELYMDFITISGKMTPHDDPHFGSWHKYYLDPEKVHTFDVGVGYDDDIVHLGINGFHSRMQNIIIQDVDTSHYEVFTWDNIDDEIVIFGLECEGSYSLTDDIFLNGSFLYQHNENKETGETNISPLPNFSIKGGISYQSDFGLMISIFNTFHQSLDPKYYDRLNKTTGYYHMTNIYCTFKVNELLGISTVKNITLIGAIDNALDEAIWLPAWNQGTTNMIPYNHGRTIYGGFTVTF